MLLKYDFAVVGLDKVYAAMAGIESRFVAGAKRMQGAVSKAGGAQMRSAGGGARALAGPGGASKHVNETERLAQRVAQAQLRQEQRAARQLETLQRRETERYRRMHQQSLDQRLRREAAAERRSLAEQHAAGRKRQEFRKTVMGNMVGGAGNAVSAAGTMALGALGVGGTAAVANAVSKAMASQKAAYQLANAAYTPGGESRESIAKRIQDIATNESKRTGLGANEMIAGMAGIQAKAGNLDVATQMAPFMADVTDMFGAEMADVGNMVGLTFSSLTKTGMDAAQAMNMTKDAVKMVAAAGQKGTVELKDMAGGVGDVLGVLSKFGGDKAKNFSDILAMVQLSAGTEAGGSAPEALTATKRFFSDVIAKSGDLKKLGVNVFADKQKTQMKDPKQIALDIIEATKGDISKAADIFGERGIKVASPLLTAYNTAEAKQKGSGRAAMEKALELSGAGATISDKDVTAGAAFARESSSKKLDMAMAELNAALSKEFLPVLTKMIPKFVEMIPSITKFASAMASLASWLMDNPFKGLSAIVAGAMVNELASASIGKLISNAIERAAGGGGGVAGAAPGVVSAAGKGGKGGVTGGGAVAALVGVAAVAAVADEVIAAKATIDQDRKDMASNLKANGGGSFVENSVWDNFKAIFTGGTLNDTMKQVGLGKEAQAMGIGNRTESTTAFDQAQKLGTGVGGAGASIQAALQGIIAKAGGGNKAADKLSASADKLSAAADKLATSGANGLNRGGSPTTPR